MRSQRRSRSAMVVLASATLLVGLLGSASSVLATGTCPGRAQEYAIPSGQRDVDPLTVYDGNGDGTICVAVKGKKTAYSDNRI